MPVSSLSSFLVMAGSTPISIRASSGASRTRCRSSSASFQSAPSRSRPNSPRPCSLYRFGLRALSCRNLFSRSSVSHSLSRYVVWRMTASGSVLVTQEWEPSGFSNVAGSGKNRSTIQCFGEPALKVNHSSVLVPREFRMERLTVSQSSSLIWSASSNQTWVGSLSDLIFCGSSRPRASILFPVTQRISSGDLLNSKYCATFISSAMSFIVAHWLSFIVLNCFRTRTPLKYGSTSAALRKR